MTSDAPAGSNPAQGHRRGSHTADWLIEAWGPDRLSCFTEAMTALVELFALPRQGAATRRVGVAVNPGSDRDVLILLLEEVIYEADALGVVPVGFHLTETAGGGVKGELDVVDAGQVELVGSVPKAVSYHDLEVSRRGETWRCRALVDV